MKQSVAGINYKDGTFLIGKRLPTGDMGNRWEFLGGKVDAGENPKQAIKREFFEEMGVDVEVGEQVAVVDFSHRDCPVRLEAYEIFMPEVTTVVLTEHTQLGRANLDEIEKMDFVDSDLLLVPLLRRWLEHG